MGPDAKRKTDGEYSFLDAGRNIGNLAAGNPDSPL